MLSESSPRTANEKAHHTRNLCPDSRMSASVLIIDDQKDDQQLYQRAFMGYECFFNLTMVSSAEEGFARIAEDKPDLILLDYNLPDVDGLSFMKRLAVHSDMHIPIVMLTSETSAALAVEVMKHGAEDYLVKDTAGSYLRLLPGVVGRVMATYTQQAEARRLQQKTRALLLRNQTLMLNSMDGIHILDAQGNLVEANDAFYRMLGYTREEMARFNVADWDKQRRAEELPERIKHHIGKRSQFESEHLRKDGTQIYVELSIAGVEIDGQNFIYASSRDITGRKQAEEARIAQLKQVAENMRLFVQQAPISIAMFDCSLNYLAASDQWIKEYGRGLTDLIGRHHYEVNPDILDEWKKIHLQCLAGATIKNDEDYWEQVDGSKHWLRWAVLPWNYPDGKIGGLIISAEDITKSKLIEQELIVLNNKLTDDVAKRTAELSALTAHVQKVAESERAKFARELHDEMGSIMTALHLEVGRLQSKASDPDLLSGLTVIRKLISKAVQSKRNIINQLYPTVLDDYGFVHAVNLMVKEYRKHYGIDVEIFMPNEDIVMAPDYALAAYRITQECLTNIAKHAGASKVRIEATDREGFLDLTIQDNGKGMPSEINVNRHGVFGMIERARYLDGSMEIGSEEGRGTTAHLILPLDVALPKNMKRVLVVDDHAIFREAIRNLIERETRDFSVEGEAADGMTAIQMAIDEEWDIMLLDINLPKMNGIKVLETINKIKSNLPIIILSSQAESEYGEKSLSKGAFCYIEKGETDKLVDAMRRASVLQNLN
jgi:PAS domain S-box-containing protein